MSKYIKLEDAINAYNQAVKKLVESEMEEFNLGDFTECSFNTTQIKLIARMIESLPTIEVSEDCISRDWVLNRLTKYQKDYALNELDDWQNTVVEWITTDIENAPSVVPSCQKNRQGVVPSCQKNRQVERAEGEWIIDVPPSTSHGTIYTCPFCGHEEEFEPTNYCPACGEKMKG